MAKLVLLLEDGATRDISLDKERITLGRRPDNDVCLPHPAVSGEHAQVVTLLADSFLEDLGSTNGTLVNGEMVQKHFLRDGDLIELGRQRLVYLADDSARPTIVHAASATRGLQDQAALSAGTPSGPTQWDRPTRTPGVHVGTTTRTTTPLTPAPAGGASQWNESSANEFAHAVARSETAQVQAEQPPELMVLTGPSAGRTLALTKEVTSVGRAGVQVAFVRRTPSGYLFVGTEGNRPPLLNGTPVAPGGALLAPGDVIEVAGARIEFSTAPDLPT